MSPTMLKDYNAKSPEDSFTSIFIRVHLKFWVFFYLKAEPVTMDIRYFTLCQINRRVWRIDRASFPRRSEKTYLFLSQPDRTANLSPAFIWICFFSPDKLACQWSYRFTSTHCSFKLPNVFFGPLPFKALFGFLWKQGGLQVFLIPGPK